MTLYKWSQVAANNGNSDATCPFPEGMNPAAVNDGARSMMAATAKYRDDMAGAIVTGGTSTAYTVSSFQGFDTLVHLDGKEIAFTPHVTNGANGSSLNVDGLGVKPILLAPGVGLPVGVLVQGTPYSVLYSNTDGAFYLRGFNAQFDVPLGSGMDYWGTTAPNSYFAFAIGQAISRTTYAGLFALLGTTFGAGDGSTTFNLPDLRGRVVAAADNMGGSAANRMTGWGYASVGGEQSHVLSVSEMPAHRHAVVITDPGHSHGFSVPGTMIGPAVNVGGGGSFFGPATSNGTTSPSTTGITIHANDSTPNATDPVGGGAAHNNIQPTIACNYIIRIL